MNGFIGRDVSMINDAITWWGGLYARCFQARRMVDDLACQEYPTYESVYVLTTLLRAKLRLIYEHSHRQNGCLSIEQCLQHVDFLAQNQILRLNDKELGNVRP